MLTYAVGDIHGRADLLRAGANAILKHARGKLFQVVFLGDYIDRGPESRQTIEILMSLRNGGRIVFLQGNHEEMLLRYLNQGSTRNGLMWMETGGGSTLASYGLDPSNVAAAHLLPKPHIDWMVRRPRVYETLNHVYVHAGIDPRRHLQEQDDRTFLWIRRPFLTASPEDFVDTRHIVHGHTPAWEGKPRMSEPELLPHRTNLDTGAFATGLLSIGVFDPEVRGPVDLISVS